MITDHVEVTIEDLFVEHYDPPKVPPKTSSAMKATRRRSQRIVPHPKSLLGVGLLSAAGVVLMGASVLAYRRWFA